MKKPILKEVTQITDTQYTNMYLYNYEYNKKQVPYYVTSRRKMTKQNANKPVADAVIVLPYIIKDNKTYIVFIKEFRYAVNSFIYDIPAGLIDKGETPQEAAVRELSEEIGATCKNLTPCTTLSYVTPGCFNEGSITFFAQVELDKPQALEEGEIIDLHILPLEEVIDFVDNNIMGVQGKMMTKIFYYQQKCKK